MCATGVLGLAVGVGIAFALPRGGIFVEDRARAALQADTAAALERVVAIADGEPVLAGAAALASTLLFVEHAGAVDARQRAEQLLKASVPSVRTSPEALAARALLTRLGNEDGTLDEDLSRRASDKGETSWFQLARSIRLLDDGKPEQALPLLQRAAFGPEASPYGAILWARQAWAHGEFGHARALATHVLRANPRHLAARMIEVTLAVIDDARDDSEERRAAKLKQLKSARPPRREAPPRPGEAQHVDEVTIADWRTPAEERALAALAELDARDAQILAVFLESIATARGQQELVTELRGRWTTSHAETSVVAREIELMLLDGDVASAEELLAPLLAEHPLDADLLLLSARAQTIKLVSEEERRGLASAGHAIRSDGLMFPLGRLTFSPSANGLPWTASFAPELVPDARFLALRRSSPASALQNSLDVAVLVWKAERALASGDMRAATDAVARAKEKAAMDPEVLLLDALIRMRAGDADSARQTVDAVVASAPDSPGALVAAARVLWDGDAVNATRRVLKKLDATGFKNPAALAIEAMVEAKSGDLRKASAALDEARSFGAESVELLTADVFVLRARDDLAATRSAADRLYAVARLRTTNLVVRAWEAEAAFRAGDTGRASGVIDDILASQPALADAHLLRGIMSAATNATIAAASFDEAARLAPNTAVGTEAATRGAALGRPPGFQVSAPATATPPGTATPPSREKTRPKRR